MPAPATHYTPIPTTHYTPADQQYQQHYAQVTPAYAAPQERQLQARHSDPAPFGCVQPQAQGMPEQPPSQQHQQRLGSDPTARHVSGQGMPEQPPRFGNVATYPARHVGGQGMPDQPLFQQHQQRPRSDATGRHVQVQAMPEQPPRFGKVTTDPTGRHDQGQARPPLRHMQTAPPEAWPQAGTVQGGVDWVSEQPRASPPTAMAGGRTSPRAGGRTSPRAEGRDAAALQPPVTPERPATWVRHACGEATAANLCSPPHRPATQAREALTTSSSPYSFVSSPTHACMSPGSAVTTTASPASATPHGFLPSLCIAGTYHFERRHTTKLALTEPRPPSPDEVTGQTQGASAPQIGAEQRHDPALGDASNPDACITFEQMRAFAAEGTPLHWLREHWNRLQPVPMQAVQES